MRRTFLTFLRLGLIAAATPCFFSACASSHHPHKIKSYDRSFTDDDADPTYKPDFERADEETRDVYH